MEAIRKANPKDIDQLIEMAVDLWPDYDREDLTNTFIELIASEKNNVLVYEHKSDFFGFIYLGIRTDYVEGSDFTPTGYVEGIYVKPAYRKTGIAARLLKAGEDWLKQSGCKQIGSDIYIDNNVSYDFHLHSGFKEAGRLITFIKNL
jgi:aminoglycoside 6'-N-acetyltransferase I